MSIPIIILLTTVVTFAVAALLFTGQGAYILDLTLAATLVPVLRVEAVLAIVALQFLGRRLPFTARGFVSLFNCHPLLARVAFPGALETVDTAETTDPRYDVRITSSGAQRARDVLLRKYLSESIRQDQKRLVEITGNPISASAENLPPEKTIHLDPFETETIAKLLAAGLSVSQIAQQLPGYSGRKYQEFVALVEAVKATIGQQAT